MFKCLYCVKYFQATKGRSHHESPYCTRILQQNVVNADDNAGFDFFTYEECELNSKEEMPHIVNEDLTYVHMQESYYKKCFSLDCLYQSTDFKSFIDIMPVYSD